VIFDKDAKVIQWRKDSLLISGAGIVAYPYAEKEKGKILNYPSPKNVYDDHETPEKVLKIGH
jgi:hypothetical protein